ncbi:MAG: YdcF family protein [Candidatus Staskawiczbacteria bacterium]|nr:YdcF family protein [Candidatus Staskawiczbacteria bacterium]
MTTKRSNDQHPTQKKSIFTFEAFAGSDYDRKSEATVIKERLVDWLGAPHLNSKRILAETLSSTTEENAAFLAIMLKRRPMFAGNEKIGILTLLYHMERAFPIFKKAGLNVEPVFAENILVLNADAKARQTQDDIRCGDWPIDAMSVDEICEYYKTPKGGKQYDVERIRQLLTEGKSLEELLFPWWYITVVDGYICADGEPEELEKTSTRFTQARDLKDAASKLNCEESFVKGPFETLEQARKG